jgi:glycosyltransferase involved in cell wall biosynthesis
MFSIQRSRSTSAPSREIKVSVVVPAYNEEDSLPACLDALKSQDYPYPYEIIVVDNASTDRTADIARQAGCRVVSESRRGYVSAITAGFAAAEGEVIACTDADSMVPSAWVSRMVGHLLTPGVVGCSGGYLFSDGPWQIRLIGFLFGRFNYHLAGANMAVWRSAFEKAGGFRPAVNLGADVELGLRLKQQGSVVIDHGLLVRTSSRRFQAAFLQTVFMYYLNDLSLYVLKRPVFHAFPNYRVGAAYAPARKPRLAFLTTFIVFFSFLLNPPYMNAVSPVFASGKKHRTVVALAFDKCTADQTATIVEELKRLHVTATFYVPDGGFAPRTNLWTRVVREGHSVENTAPVGTSGSCELGRILRLDMGAALRDGQQEATSAEDLCNLDRWCRVWTTPCASAGSGEVRASAMAEEIARNASSGSTILLHGQAAGNTDMLSSLVQRLKRQGYRIVSVEDVAADEMGFGFKEAFIEGLREITRTLQFPAKTAS